MRHYIPVPSQSLW